MNAAVLKTLVECPICFRVPRSKILACNNGHKICESCYDKIVASAKQCPQGNCQYDQTPRRCRELEAIVDNVEFDFSCSNEDAGCRMEMGKEELRKHEFECEFRQVPCPNTTCGKMILLNILTAHIRDSHQIRILEDPFNIKLR